MSSLLEEFRGMLKLHQTEYSKSLKKLSPSSFTAQEFAHLRGQLAYIATSTRPDNAFVSAQLAQVKPQDATVNSVISDLVENPRGIGFAKLDLETLQVRGYADALFDKNADYTSQLGMAFVLSYSYGNE